MRRRAECLTHIQQVHHQHNQALSKNIKYKANQEGLGDNLPYPHSKLIMNVDLELIEAYTEQIKRLELELIRSAKLHHFQSYYRLTKASNALIGTETRSESISAVGCENWYGFRSRSSSDRTPRFSEADELTQRKSKTLDRGLGLQPIVRRLYHSGDDRVQ